MAIVKDSLMTTTDLGTVINEINKARAKYALAALNPTITKDSLAYGSQIVALLTGVREANTKAGAGIAMELVDADFAKDSYILASKVALLMTKATAVYNYCACQCNNCTCDCDYCSCDCNNCTCVGNTCSCNCAICSCQVQGACQCTDGDW